MTFPALHLAGGDARLTVIPALGGKMILPAPRNRAKVIKPRANRSGAFKRVM